jgi:hypothetical protein
VSEGEIGNGGDKESIKCLKLEYLKGSAFWRLMNRWETVLKCILRK